jgi:hypothetical protein
MAGWSQTIPLSGRLNVNPSIARELDSAGICSAADGVGIRRPYP